MANGITTTYEAKLKDPGGDRHVPCLPVTPEGKLQQEILFTVGQRRTVFQRRGWDEDGTPVYWPR